eukprot:SAG11_NODE_4899_length_1730_cov_1.749847_1_plen_90_part_00
MGALIATAAPLMRRAGVTTNDGKGGRKSSGRTNDLTWLPHDHSLAVWRVVQRISELVAIPSEHAEKLQVQLILGVKSNMYQYYTEFTDY